MNTNSPSPQEIHHDNSSYDANLSWWQSSTERYGRTDEGHLTLRGGRENHPTAARTVELCGRGGMAADLSHNWYITEVRASPGPPTQISLYFTTLLWSSHLQKWRYYYSLNLLWRLNKTYEAREPHACSWHTSPVPTSTGSPARPGHSQDSMSQIPCKEAESCDYFWPIHQSS